MKTLAITAAIKNRPIVGIYRFKLNIKGGAN